MAQVDLQVNAQSWQENAYRIANNIRRRVLEHSVKNNGGYMSQACSAAELFATLYTKIMNIGASEAPMVPPQFNGVPANDNLLYKTGRGYNGPISESFDRFIFSPAHYALVLYTTLIEVGRMASDGLEHFNQDGSSVEMIAAEHSPGCELTNGSLAQALSQAVGIALARRMKGDSGRVFVMLSDGEFQEGQTWEALESMIHYKLDNMVLYVDVNGQCCDGKMCDVMSIEPLDKRLEAFGARVFNVNAHDVEQLAAPAALAPDGRATVVLCNSNPTQGLELLNDRAPKLHYLRFKSEDERDLYRQELKKMQAEFSA